MLKYFSWLIIITIIGLGSTNLLGLPFAESEPSHEFPDLSSYSEMLVPYTSMYQVPRSGGYYLPFNTSENIKCIIFPGGQIGCQGREAQYLPMSEVAKYQNAIKKYDTQNSCFFYSISTSSIPSTQLTGNGSVEDCSSKNKPDITTLQPHHKITYNDAVCGKGDNGMLACIDNNTQFTTDHQKHGFVLLPNYQSWAF